MTKIEKKVYRSYARGLGDCWLSINYILNLALNKNEVIDMSLWYAKGEKIRRVDKLKEILPLFEHSDLINLVELESTEPKIHQNLFASFPCIPFKIKWKKNNSKKICYQFDAKSRKNQRFPSKEIENDILCKIKNMGYKVIKLGGHLTLEECVIELSECEMMIGVDTGMPNITGSVGTPLLYCLNGRDLEAFKILHSNKHFLFAKDNNEVVKHILSYNEKGLQYYKENAWNIECFKKGE